jgi:hypothetical protein
MIVTTTCPTCGCPAEIRDRAVLESTDGPVEHAKVSCVNRHWYFLPVADLERPCSQTATGSSDRRSAPIVPK